MLKKSRIALALTLAIVLSIGALAPMALAETPTFPEYLEAAITKVLQMPIGTTVPTGDFRFLVDPVSVNEDTSVMPPSIADDDLVKIAFPVDKYTIEPVTVSDVTTYYLESDELFGDVKWPSAGVFEYTITEVENTFTLEANETMTYSKASYTIKVYVGEEGDYLKILGIAARRFITDAGDPIDNGLKVDPTPGGGGSTEYDYSQMTFTNTYTKRGGGSIEDDEATLTIGIEVDGELASTGTYFDFEITVNQPSLVEGEVLYKAYIVDGDGNILTNLSNNGVTPSGTDDDGNPYVLIKAGEEFEFKLKHGESLVFVDTHVGANYEVSIDGAPGYVTSAIITEDGEEGPEAEGERGEGLKIPDGIKYPTNPLVGEKTNKAEFKNTNNIMPDTGLSMSDLPFYVLILLAIGAVATPVAIKAISRNKNK